MKYSLLVLLSVGIALAGFGSNVRIDHEDDPNRGCQSSAITLGPGTWTSQPLYVVFEDDSVMGMAGADIMFQKSTDAGRTWLPADVLVRRGSTFATYPDITTDSDGNVYVVYTENDPPSHHINCVQSMDGGSTWSPPTRVDDHDASWLVGSARIAADSVGNLLCAWNDDRTGSLHIWSSVSTDQGTTWSQNVRVDDDTTNHDCYQADVFVQPGTNHYLVVAEAPNNRGLSSYLYRSTDGGQTFQPGVRLDTFRDANASQPHVVADAQHVICDYSGGRTTEARTLYTQPDTWGSPRFVGWSYYNGTKLAISADGSVHTALMARDSELPYLIYYAYSSDHGVSWSERELVNDDTTSGFDNPDIGADSAGHAYIVWMTQYIADGEIWFATTNPAAIAEQPPQPCATRPIATVVRDVLFLPEATSCKPQAASLLDATGSKVMDLKPGANDVSALAPGVYFVKEAQAQAQAQAVRKVVLTR